MIAEDVDSPRGDEGRFSLRNEPDRLIEDAQVEGHVGEAVVEGESKPDKTNDKENYSSRDRSSG